MRVLVVVGYNDGIDKKSQLFECPLPTVNKNAQEFSPYYN